MKCGVIVFPGSNCDHDCYHILKHVFNLETRFLWHKETTVGDVDLLVFPGGFSYGDYLRSGAIARFSPIVKSAVQFAEKGGRVLGICNGFQILVEAGLLPGALMRNRSQKFICRDVHLRVENRNTVFTRECPDTKSLKIPIAHHDGNYFVDAATHQRLVDENRIVFRYSSAAGDVDDSANPNGSTDNIAGVINSAGNVLGMMPHPERCADPLWSNVDGQWIFKSLIQSFS